jgi:hypothetical protein
MRMKDKDVNDLDEERKSGKKANGWYRIPSESGFDWRFFKNDKPLFELAGTYEWKGNLIELWAGNNVTGNSETLSFHRKTTKLEKEAENFMDKHNTKKKLDEVV